MTVITFPISYEDAMRPDKLDGISNLFSIVVMTELMYPELNAC
jgi:hypothetical protein